MTFYYANENCSIMDLIFEPSRFQSGNVWTVNVRVCFDYSWGTIPSNPLFKHFIRAPLLFIYVLFQSTSSERVNKRVSRWFLFFVFMKFFLVKTIRKHISRLQTIVNSVFSRVCTRVVNQEQTRTINRWSANGVWEWWGVPAYIVRLQMLFNANRLIGFWRHRYFPEIVTRICALDVSI